jgi:8-oxo-dGTP diphosphatase
VWFRQEIQAVSREAELNEARAAADSEVLDVIVGILTQNGGKVLISRRLPGTHMAGCWEFPGGKLEPGEAPSSGLERELAEELGIRVTAAEPLITHRFDYPDRAVRLDVWWVTAYEGQANSHEGQELAWVDAAALEHSEMLPADAPIVAAIQSRLARR